jgi:DNA-binding HxlR family transcriptional regulator
MNDNEFTLINDDECQGFQAAAELAGRKWNAAILLAGARGARRFSEYRARVDGISDRLLAARLKELEREALIAREVQPTTPVSISYSPTVAGLHLIQLLRPLVEWNREHEAAQAAAPSRERSSPITTRGRVQPSIG